MGQEALKEQLRDMGYSEEDPEWERLLSAAANDAEPVEEDEADEAREQEDEDEAAQAQEDVESERAQREAVEADNSELRTLMTEVRDEISGLNERIGDLEDFRQDAAERYGIVTSDEEEAEARAGEAEDQPLATDEEFENAREQGYEGVRRLFGNIMERFKQQYGEAPVPEGAKPTARSLNFVRRAQAVSSPAERPHWE